MTETWKEKIVKESKSVTKDPICGMTVDEAIALHADRDGKTFIFAVTTAGKRFCLPPPTRSPWRSRAAVVDDIPAHEPGEHSKK